MAEPTRRFTLRDLPFVARLVLAVFLISVGIGYFSALVQLHVQQATPGQLLPGNDELIANYHGKNGMGVLERLVTANENLPLTGTGSMRSALTSKALDWNEQEFDKRAEKNFKATLPGDLTDEEKDDKWAKLAPEEIAKKLEAAQQELRKEHVGDADALATWIHDGLDKESYENDNYPRPASLKDTPITPKFVTPDKKGIKIHTLLRSRCERCHSPGREVPDVLLVDHKHLMMYAKKDVGEGGMPLRKLAQSTHVHLLGFSMLYMLTGLIFALSGWPAIIRFLIAPLALVAQVADISFWWLARMQDPYGSEFAKCIRYSGGVVAVALGLQIILGLFSLFGWFGRLVLLLLILAALVGAYFLNDMVIAPYLASQAKLGGP